MENFESSKRKAALNIQGSPHKTQISQWKLCRLRKSGMTLFTILREKNICQPRILYPESSPTETKDKTYPNKKAEGYYCQSQGQQYAE